MCGRFYTDDDDAQYRQVIALLYQRNPQDAALLLRRSGEIFPADKVPVLGADGPRMMERGFSRYDGKGRVINARGETAREKNMFRGPMQTGRCLIPACAYFEWETRESKKLKYSLRPKGEGMFYFAGLWRPENGKELPLFVILTTPAANGISFIHDRMPLMLNEEKKAQWLGDPADAARLLGEGLRDVAFERCG